MTQSLLYGHDFYKDRDDMTRSSATEVIPLLLELTGAKSVADMGCGVGTWLSVFKEMGADRVQGFDGPWVEPELLEIQEDNFEAIDLAQNFPIIPKCDLAMSLEVAEHVAEDRALDFVKTLTNAAPVVFFSAAVPGQGGTGHINEQWLSYWCELFEQCGYQLVDCLRDQFWENEKVVCWYSQNMVLFAKRGEDYEGLVEKAKPYLNPSRQLNVIHPKLFVIAIASLRKTVAELKQNSPSTDSI